ncbi:MAG: hypothetical protein HY819_19390 [Acidobacteria bacterium]|nr:hypothetical protein [Acidobacteriota bacterium]
MLKKAKRLIKGNDGFTALEWIICTVLLAIIFTNLAKVMISSLKNGLLVQKVADTAFLSTQKANELFNDSKKQLAKIPSGQTKIGSIDPSNPVDGYFDLFNASACLLRTTSQLPPTKITVEGQPTSNSNISTTSTNSTNSETPQKSGIGKGGELGNGDSDGNFSRIDCSTSTFKEPNQSLEPRYRRQWMIIKDFPNKNDVTFSVIVVHYDKNKILRSYTLSKTDGTISK